MAAKKVGDLIKEARANAGMTQAKLADTAGAGLTAKDISAAERGQKELTSAQLRAIAKATGVTQKSLLDAAAGKSVSSSSAAKKENSSKKETSSAAKASSDDFRLTATEKKLIELYRKADSDTKKSVMSTLKGEKSAASGLFETLVGSVGSLLTREMPQNGEPEDGQKNG